MLKQAGVNCADRASNNALNSGHDPENRPGYSGNTYSRIQTL
jgi:hypothetical protein